ncbi:MAG: PAS domain S-box protein [Cellvibrionaceae bacterium]|nr:PAS domain S-box protein [Cellvibrionaceae bacterium]
MPIVLVSLIDERRQWFKSRFGLTIPETPRDLSFCAYAIQNRDLLIVEDAFLDTRFLNNLLVISQPGIRFYAGQPIFSPDRHVLGTLCLIDTKPRQLLPSQISSLQDFALLIDEEISKSTVASSVLERQKALRDSDVRFRSTFEQAAVGIAHVDLQGQWLRVNQKLCDIVGYKKEELERLTFQDITFPEDLEKGLELVKELLVGERQTFSFEKRYVHKSSAIIWVNVTVSLVRKRDGSPDYCIAVIEDIQARITAQAELKKLNAELESRVTERTRDLQDRNEMLAREVSQRLVAEAVLKASEHRIRTIIDGSLDAFIAIDSNGVITDWNRAAENIFGWRREEVIGTPLAETIIPPQFRELHRDGLEKFIATGHGAIINRRLELPSRTKNGGEIPVEMAISVCDVDGQYCFSAFLHDISQRHQVTQALAEKQHLLDTILDTVDIAVIACSSQNDITILNRAARGLLDLREGLTAGSCLRDLKLSTAGASEDLANCSVSLLSLMQDDEVKDMEMLIGSGAHATHTVLISSHALSASSGERFGTVLAMKDITERKTIEMRQMESEERLRMIADNLPVLIAYLDLDLRYRFANQKYREWYGVEHEQMAGKTIVEVFGEHFYELRRRYLHRCLAGETVRLDIELDNEASSRIIESIYIPDKKGNEVVGLYVLSTDVTTIRQQEAKLNALARVDTLTGLWNRRSYEEKFREAVSRAARAGQLLGLLFLDVDYFKKINDTLGHAGGDIVLREFAHRLKSSVRETDSVFRLAGDEFTIILEGIRESKDVEVVAQKIVETIRRPFQVSDKELAVTTSIGAVVGHLASGDIEALNRRADEALYEAKGAGRNRYYLIDKELGMARIS